MWNSLLEGKKVVDRGSMWRVGDGQKIDVWRNLWLKKPPNFKVNILDSQTPTPLKVAKLIDSERRRWDMDIVQEIFSEEDVSLITSIPLSKRTSPDQLIWRDSKIGMLTVKSAYVVARGLLGKEVINQNQRNRVWDYLWKARVGPKIKLFSWRLIQGSVPTTTQLQRRGLSVEDRCTVCGQQGETLRHAFLDCRLSNAVWRLLSPEIEQFWAALREDMDIWGLLFDWLRDKELAEIWMCGVWLIWNNRNKCFHNQICRLPTELARMVYKLKEEFLTVSGSLGMVGTTPLQRWIPPPREYVKINVDAAYNQNTKIACLGMVMRDYTGTIGLCAVQKVQNIHSPLQAELMAILFGLEVSRSSSLLSIMVESDSLLAIKEISKNQESYCEWGSIILDITQASMDYLYCSFHHIGRSANKCAHNIAKCACELGQQMIWRNSLPPLFCNPDTSS